MTILATAHPVKTGVEQGAMMGWIYD